jgi:hypothetical protein
MINPLLKPMVHLDFYQIRNGGRKLSPVAEEFAAFLKNYIVTWAGKIRSFVEAVIPLGDTPRP